MARGARFKLVKIKWNRIKPDAKLKYYSSHKLEDAIIVSIKGLPKPTSTVESAHGKLGSESSRIHL